MRIFLLTLHLHFNGPTLFCVCVMGFRLVFLVQGDLISELTVSKDTEVNRVAQAQALYCATVITQQDAEDLVTKVVQSIVSEQGLDTNVEMSFLAMEQYVSKRA